MSYSHYLALAAAALILPSCSLFNKGEEDYDTVDGAGDAGYDHDDPHRPGPRHRLAMMDTGWTYQRDV